MRLFQLSSAYNSYLTRRSRYPQGATTFKARIAGLLHDRSGGVHILAPILNCDTASFYTIGNDEELLRTWAREMGMNTKASLVDILLAQIESHRTEVLYNTHPVRYGNEFVRRLPGCVRKAVAWHNAPDFVKDFSKYDLVLCNSHPLLKGYRERGWRAEYFTPAHDPAMNEYACNNDRPIDVLFAGGYSRYHMRRAKVLEAVAGLRDHLRIEFCLDRSRFTRLAESPVGYLGMMGKYRRPQDIRAVSHDPVFGRDMYALISRAKIVLNGSGDQEGESKGNMRCFEAMGCRSLLLSEEGSYPAGMVAGKTLIAYKSPSDVVDRIEELLRNPGYARGVADAGYEMMLGHYSKQQQWNTFKALISCA